MLIFTLFISEKSWGFFFIEKENKIQTLLKIQTHEKWHYNKMNKIWECLQETL